MGPLEQSPSRPAVLLHEDAGLLMCFGSRWTELPDQPQKEFDGRQICWPRGEVLGESSLLNTTMWAGSTATMKSRAGSSTSSGPIPPATCQSGSRRPDSFLIQRRGGPLWSAR